MRKHFFIPMLLLAIAAALFAYVTTTIHGREQMPDVADNLSVQQENTTVATSYEDVDMYALAELMQGQATHTQEVHLDTSITVDEQACEVDLMTDDTIADRVYFDVPLSEDLQDYIFELSDEYDVPASMIVAIIDNESKFDSDEISSTNDYGLMQINKCNHEAVNELLGVTDILDPYENVLAGTYLYAECLDAAD